MAPRARAVVTAVSVIIAGCLVGVLAKLSLRDVPPFTFVWLQIAIGGSLLSLYTFGWRRERFPKRLGWSVWAYVLAIGVGNFTIVRVLFLLALERLPVTTHTFLVNFVGIVTMAMSVFILRERPSRVQVVGSLVAIAGLWVFFAEVPAPAELTGVIYLAIAVGALATTNNLARKLAIVTDHALSNNVVSTLACWIGGIPVVLYGIATDWPPAVGGGDAGALLLNWGIIAINGLVAIAIGLTVWNAVLRTLRSYEASVLAASSVIFTALFAIPILGDRLARHEMLGIALMLVGLSLAQIRARGPR